jgi:protein-tyrosine phosphatase
VAERGADLSDHRTRQLTVDMVQQADRIYAMGSSHMRDVLALVASAEPKTRLLRAGQTIEDPIGGTEDDYRRTRDEIAGAVEPLIKDAGNEDLPGQ